MKSDSKKEVKKFMAKVYIFGHKKPDTDSVSSCIALAYLKQQLGMNAEPRILSAINKETKFALNYFGVKEPAYLNDVKLQLKDTGYHRKYYLQKNASIYDAYLYMLSQGLTGVPVVQEDNSFLGIITIKDLAHNFINAEVRNLNTSYQNVLSVLRGEEVVKATDEIVGNLLVASYRSTTFIHNVTLTPNDILIVGDRHSVIEYAVASKVKLIIIVGNGEMKEEHIKQAYQNQVNVIRTNYDTYHVARLIALSNYVSTILDASLPAICFDEKEYVGDVLEINKKLRHTNYPVVNRKKKCLGLLRITDLDDKHPKKVILVDHNEKIQSAEGLEEAEILEIIDHHNLGSITTTQPVNFRNMAVGSTCTIVYQLYKEQRIKIPRQIAGLLLSGILSDTLILKSPTATKVDIEAVETLQQLAQVDYKKYGMELLKAGTSLKGMSKEEVLYNDFKLYTVDEKKFGIGQFFTMNFQEIEKEASSYIDVLDEVAEANQYQLVALYITDIVRNGSYILFNRKAKELLELAYKVDDLKEGTYFKGCVSRKKHVVPILMDVFEK